MNYIECKNLTRDFEGDGTKTVALKNVNLSFEKGEQPSDNEETENSYETPGEYELEFKADETSKNTGWGGILFYMAKEIESSLPLTEAGKNNIAIEFSFEILDTMTYEMRPKQHFSLHVGDETYRPVNVEVLETVAWKDEGWLNGYRDGKIRAVLEFTVPENVKSYGLLFKNGTVGKGIMVRFEK